MAAKKLKIDDIDLDILYRFMENGSVKDVPEEIAYYLELLEKIYAMSHKIDKYGSKEMIIKHLILSQKAKGQEISRYKASQMYDEAMEYFYVGQRVSKQAFRNMYASQIEKLLNLAMVTYKGASDLRGIASLFKELRELRQLDKADNDQENPLDNKPFNIITSNPEDIGIPKIDRRELIEYVDSIPDISEIMREKIKRDANLLTPKLIMNEQENPYRTE